MSAEFTRAGYRRLCVWTNAIGDAWNMGEAPWAYEVKPGGVAGSHWASVAVALWSRVYAETSDCDAATEAVVELARSRGIDPRRHKVHAR